MSHWWRAYDGAVDHPKLLLLTDRQHRAWFNLMCLASSNGGALPDLKVIAVKLRMSSAKAATLISELKVAVLLDDEDGKITPHNWNGRQFKTATDEKKESYVYFIGSAWDAPALKIGFSKNPWARISELQTAHHDKLEVLSAFRCRAHSEVDIHDLLKPFRKNGEWFSLPEGVCQTIQRAADRSSSYEDLVVELRSMLRSNTTGLLRSTTTETETETETDSEKKEDIRGRKFKQARPEQVEGRP